MKLPDKNLVKDASGKIKNLWIIMRNNKWILAIFINILFLSFGLLFGTLTFETNDDRDISNLFSDVYIGNASSYGVFINVLFGYILKPFYTYFSVINWYVIFCLIFNFISLISITLCILQKKAGKLEGLLVISFLLLFYQDSYVNFQFSKNASLYLASGFLLILTYSLKWNINTRKDKVYKFGLIVLGICLMILGSLIRYQSFLGCLPFILVVCLSLCVRELKDVRNLKKLSIFICSVVIVIIFIFGAREFQLSKFEQYPEWEIYREYNKIRANITDYDPVSLDEKVDEIEEFQISYNDYQLLMSWTFADTNVYSLENIKKLNDIVEINKKKDFISKNLIIEFLNVLIDVNGEHNVLLVIFFLGLIYVFLFQKNYVFEILILFVIIFGEIYAFVLVGRVVYRALYGVFLFGIVLLIYYITESKKKEFIIENFKLIEKKYEYRIFKLIVIGTVILWLPDTLNMISNTLSYEENVAYEEFLDEVQKNKEILYLVDRPTLTRIEENYSPYKVISKGAYENVCILGGWIYPTPVNNVPLKRFDVLNPMQALVENSGNVYLVDGISYEMKKKFLEEHYGGITREEIVKETTLYNIYSIGRN